MQETDLMQVGGQLVNITNKTPTVGGGKIVISTNKVFMGADNAEVVTGKTGKKRERQVLAMEEGKFRQQTSLADLQDFVEIDQKDRDESPKFEPVQESSPHEMPPTAQGLLISSDGDPNPPAVRGSWDENCHKHLW